MNAIETRGLGRRHGRRWALEDCTIDVPLGRTIALVGPNGAGKTTLLHLAVGLTFPSTGTISIFGAPPSQSPRGLERVGFVAQDVPLYRSLTVNETLEMGRRLNRTWDDGFAHAQMDRLRLPHDERVGNLSGGQRVQLALCLAVAKRPDLLVLDEPLASLDPRARRMFLQDLMGAAAERELTIVFSSHLISDLERVCDHLIVLDRGRTLVADDIDAILTSHALLVGPPADAAGVPGVAAVIRQERTSRQTMATVRLDHQPFDHGWRLESVGLEDLILAYLEPNAPELARPVGVAT